MTPVQSPALLYLLSAHTQLVLSLTCFPDNGYTLQPSATTTVPQTPDGLRSLRACSNQCMADACCMSYGLKDGQCETAPFKSHDLDYVKEGTCTGDCPDAATCTVDACPGEYGGTGGLPYTFFPQFSATRDEITKVTLTSTMFGGVEFLTGIGMTFGTVSQYFTVSGNAMVNTLSDPSPYECILAPGEYISESTMYEGSLFGFITVQSGLKFVTTSKVCGPYGFSGGVQRTYKGNKLMYIHGRLGMAFDKFAFFYDKCIA